MGSIASSSADHHWWWWWWWNGTLGAPQPDVAERTSVLALDPSLETVDVELVLAGEVPDLVPLLEGAETNRAGRCVQRIHVVVDSDFVSGSDIVRGVVGIVSRNFFTIRVGSESERDKVVVLFFCVGTDSTAILVLAVLHGGGTGNHSGRSHGTVGQSLL